MRCNGGGLLVFPTRVGVDLVRPSSRHAATEFSPHAWGWTVYTVMSAGKSVVFPTRVGVDLNSAGHLARLASFPHTRGGGPRWRQDG